MPRSFSLFFPFSFLGGSFPPLEGRSSPPFPFGPGVWSKLPPPPRRRRFLFSPPRPEGSPTSLFSSRGRGVAAPLSSFFFSLSHPVLSRKRFSLFMRRKRGGECPLFLPFFVISSLLMIKEWDVFFFIDFFFFNVLKEEGDAHFFSFLFVFPPPPFGAGLQTGSERAGDTTPTFFFLPFLPLLGAGKNDDWPLAFFPFLTPPLFPLLRIFFFSFFGDRPERTFKILAPPPFLFFFLPPLRLAFVNEQAPPLLLGRQA